MTTNEQQQDEGRERRRRLIRTLERRRKSKVITYVTGDREGATVTIGPDDVRPMYEHILQLRPSKEKHQRIDLFLYSRGGAVQVPWQIVSMFRQHCNEFNVLIPYKAHSAATMLALGADNIVMGKKAELGPIDAQRNLVREVVTPQGLSRPPQEVNVEDLMSFVDFLKERGGLTDQAGLARSYAVLLEKLHPWEVGGIYRNMSPCLATRLALRPDPGPVCRDGGTRSGG